ncbi:MAG TPA: RNA methyltransferase [Chloroflexia bacterium]|nr:RNA methyltransferase [Chloroflexia bacterium]
MPSTMLIDSPSNPIVKSLRSLAGGARQRRETGLFLAEGVRVVSDGLDAGQVARSCLYDAEALARTEKGRLLLRRLQAIARSATGRVFEATARAVAAASDTQHPQGVVAAFPIPHWVEPAGTGKAALALICDDIQDPGNLGTILRTAEASGVDAVWLTERCVGLYSPKVVRAAMGAHFRLPCFPDATWPVIEASLANLGIQAANIYAAEVGATLNYDEVDWNAPAALIVSNEARGLGEEARQLATRGGGLLAIPMLGGTESLNAAVATAVILFEAARQRRVAPTADK